jgi:hypothetical protein
MKTPILFHSLRPDHLTDFRTHILLRLLRLHTFLIMDLILDLYLHHLEILIFLLVFQPSDAVVIVNSILLLVFLPSDAVMIVNSTLHLHVHH